MSRGPVEVLFLSFPPAVAPEEMVEVLRRPVDQGLLGLIDLVFLAAEGDGTVSMLDVEETSWPEPAVAGLAFDAHTLLSDADLETLAGTLAPGQQALAVVVEHLWAKQVTGRLDAMGAEVALHVRVPGFDVEAAFAADLPA